MITKNWLKSPSATNIQAELDSNTVITTVGTIPLMRAGVMWRLCGFCGAKSTAKKARGLLSLEWDEFK